MATRLISSAVGIVILVAVFFLHDTIVLPLILAAVIGIILFELCRVVDGLRFRLAATAVLAYGISAPLLHFGAAAVEDGARALEAPMSVMEMIWLPLCLLALFLEFLWHHGDYKVEQLAFMARTGHTPEETLSELCDTWALSFSDGKELDDFCGACIRWVCSIPQWYNGGFIIPMGPPLPSMEHATEGLSEFEQFRQWNAKKT